MNESPELLLDNVPSLSVSELSGALKRSIEDAFGRVRVRGELSKVTIAKSGHLYTDLRDDQAVLRAVCWKGQLARLGAKPEEGMEVICTGRITTFAGRSEYQLVIEQMELAGAGALLQMLAARREKLAKEGLFDSARKRPLPFLPRQIGVITSPSGAVIRDILHRLQDRFPRPVLLWPVVVQGSSAASSIIAALEGFNRMDNPPDLLIVARGGGSVEDLLPFNDEALVRAVAASKIPVISAVGHETDTNLIDFAADRRAPTPTAAAEMAVPVRSELQAQLLDLQRRAGVLWHNQHTQRRQQLGMATRILANPERLLEAKRQRLDDVAIRLQQAPRFGLQQQRVRLAELARRLLTPRDLLHRQQQHVMELASRLRLLAEQRLALAMRRQQWQNLTERLPRAIGAYLVPRANRAGQLAQLLESYSHQRTLERGFVLVRDAAGHPVTKAADLRAKQQIQLYFADGDMAAEIRAKAAQGTLL